jgi:hypothetical protein
VQPSAVKIKEGDDLEGSHLDVEGVSILQVVVPYFIDRVMEELGTATLSCIVVGVVLKL